MMRKRPLFVKPLEIEVQSEYPPFFSVVVASKIAGSGQLSKCALREQIEMLRDKENIRGVISLTRHGAESGILEELGVEYLHLPTVDKCPLTIRDIMTGSIFVDTINAKGGVVLVHCREGIGRTGTMIAGWMMVSLRMCATEALIEIRAKRTSSVHQHHQELRLKQLERVIANPVDFAAAKKGEYDESHLDFGYIKAAVAALFTRMNTTHLAAAYFFKLLAYSEVKGRGDAGAAAAGNGYAMSAASAAAPKYLQLQRSPLWKPKLNGFKSLIAGANINIDAPPDDVDDCGSPVAADAKTPAPLSPARTPRRRSATQATAQSPARAPSVASPGLSEVTAQSHEPVPATPSCIRKVRANSGVLVSKAEANEMAVRTPQPSAPIRRGTNTFLATEPSEDAATALSDLSPSTSTCTNPGVPLSVAALPPPAMGVPTPPGPSVCDSLDSSDGLNASGGAGGRARKRPAGTSIVSTRRPKGSTTQRCDGCDVDAALIPRPPNEEGGVEGFDDVMVATDNAVRPFYATGAPADGHDDVVCGEASSPRGAAGRGRARLCGAATSPGALVPVSPPGPNVSRSPRDTAVGSGFDAQARQGGGTMSPRQPPGKGDRPTSASRVAKTVLPLSPRARGATTIVPSTHAAADTAPSTSHASSNPAAKEPLPMSPAALENTPKESSNTSLEADLTPEALTAKRSMPPIVGKRAMSPILPRDLSTITSPIVQSSAKLRGCGGTTSTPSDTPFEVTTTNSAARTRAIYHHERSSDNSSSMSPVLGRRSSKPVLLEGAGAGAAGSGTGQMVGLQDALSSSLRSPDMSQVLTKRVRDDASDASGTPMQSKPNGNTMTYTTSGGGLVFASLVGTGEAQAGPQGRKTRRHDKPPTVGGADLDIGGPMLSSPRESDERDRLARSGNAGSRSGASLARPVRTSNAGQPRSLGSSMNMQDDVHIAHGTPANAVVGIVSAHRVDTILKDEHPLSSTGWATKGGPRQGSGTTSMESSISDSDMLPSVNSSAYVSLGLKTNPPGGARRPTPPPSATAARVDSDLLTCGRSSKSGDLHSGNDIGGGSPLDTKPLGLSAFAKPPTPDYKMSYTTPSEATGLQGRRGSLKLKRDGVPSERSLKPLQPQQAQKEPFQRTRTTNTM